MSKLELTNPTIPSIDDVVSEDDVEAISKTDIPETVVPETVVPAYTAPTAPTKDEYDAWAEKNGVVDEQGYYNMYGLDPDRDYQDTVNTLNYEYQTSMANYGQNAEQLYQMGLANSGVSDIFQANAFSAYLSNMNDAAVNRITAKKQNKAQYQAYFQGKKGEYQQYSDAFDAQEESNLNSAMSYALENYNGYNIEDVKQTLVASGYYQETIDQVAQRLNAIDPTNLKGETSLSLAGMIFTTILPDYSGSDEDKQTVRNMLGNTVDAEALEDAFVMADARVGSMKDVNTNDAWNAISGLLSAESSDAYIKLQLQNAGFDATDELVASMREKLDQGIGVIEQEEQIIIDNTATDIVDKVKNSLSDTASKNGGVITFADRVTAINQITEYMNGAESQIAKDAQETYRVDNYNDINGFISGDSGYDLADAPTRLEGFLNVDATAWGGMSDDDRKKAIIEAAVSAGTDMIHADELQSLVSNYVDWKTGDILGFDEHNSGETGLADAGGLVTYINGLGISSSVKKTLIKAVAENMGFKVERNSILAIDQLKWGNDAEATVHFAISDTKSYEKDEELINTLNGNEIGHMSYCDGKVYYRKPKNGKYVWYECTEDMLYVYGDGHTNTDEERAGIYELLVALLSAKSTAEIKGGGAGEASDNHNYMQSATTNPDRGRVIQEQR